MVGSFALVFTCSAMAVTAKRTLANVKSSAIRPRHPEVPNLIGDVVMRRYSRPETVESRKLKDKSCDPKLAGLRRALVSGKGSWHWRREHGEEGRTKQNRAGDVRNAAGRPSDRASGGFEQAGGVRQYHFGPGRVVLYVEGQA